MTAERKSLTNIIKSMFDNRQARTGLQEEYDALRIELEELLDFSNIPVQETIFD